MELVNYDCSSTLVILHCNISHSLYFKPSLCDYGFT